MTNIFHVFTIFVDMKDNGNISLWSIFWTFCKIGAFTVGGGYAMIPIIQEEMDKKGWIKTDELPDIVALSQSAPGILAVNISIFAGHKIRGIKGSIIATLGSILPSFLIILAIAILFTSYQDNPIVVKIFSGIRPVVISLIAVPMYNMARKNNKNILQWLVSIVCLLLVCFLNISPVYIIIAIIVLSISILYIKNKLK